MEGSQSVTQSAWHATTRIKGAHTLYIDHPEDMAAAMRPFLRVASGAVQARQARENES